MISGNKGAETYREITGQAHVWSAALSSIEGKRRSVPAILGKGAGGAPILFAGCGSSYNLSIVAAATLKHLTGFDARALPSSDVLMLPKLVFPRRREHVLVAVSRSGETTETLQALDYFKKNVPGPSLALTCYENSTLAREAGESLVASAAKESSVVGTGSVAAMLLMSQLAAAYAAGSSEFEAELRRLPLLVDGLLRINHPYVRDLAGDRLFQKFVFLGTGPYYGLAADSSLKLKEMALVCSESYHSLEFRHGPIASLDDHTLVFCLSMQASAPYEGKLIAEIKEKGAKTFVICEKADGGLDEADYLVEINSGLSDFARSCLYLPLLQLFAYYQGMLRGLDPDHPRFLESVTKLD